MNEYKLKWQEMKKEKVIIEWKEEGGVPEDITVYCLLR